MKNRKLELFRFTISCFIEVKQQPIVHISLTINEKPALLFRFSEWYMEEHNEKITMNRKLLDF